ncbi:Metallopeptidase toxin 4 [Tenacibaculum sp. MAR_2009_124]|uniref:zincin-like metallopeptidase toxin domain-containing protein n=1 Tax=Tenacibaculum sp. MAR_2009_124 TaxID=1250059 RepID=UPI000895FE41|nr:zincin-like metallopeptidase toxin domain-containing protein [Tenacibaculum sp. MAR_2009_124]SEC42339.1 Metallopeptidase toxin 4 [Tenacibaculum sp. MAR_2009_124]
MAVFKTLDELNEFNKKGFEQIFGLKKIERPESPFKEGSFDDLKFNARPHEVFNLDWKTYGSIDFADKFLPYIKKYYKGKGMWMYDGAELFNGLKKTERKLFTFDEHKYLISLINYTYPKGVLAQERKDRIKISDNELLTFIEVDESENIDIQFKFGKRFKNYLKKSFENSETKLSTVSLENKIYQTDKTTFQSFFKQELVHENMIRYVLSTLGVEKEATELAKFNALFSKKVISFMEDFTVAGKYKPYVFIEKSQRAVQLKTDSTINEGVKVTPKSNEIYIWLVYKSSSFIKVQLGTNVAKGLKEREITQDVIEQLIIKEIKAELDTNIYSKKTIDRATHKGLGEALIQLWILERKESSGLNSEIFNTNPSLFLALEAANFAIEKIENYKFKEHHWNPKLKNYLPLIEGDTLFNAQVCGFVNGIIDEVRAIPEMLAFFSKIMGSEKEMNAFVDGLKKLFEEGIFQAIIEGATKEYVKAVQEGNVERLYYNLAHDVIQIVSLLIGVFQLAKGVSSFINFSKKGLKYIKRYGRKGIDDLKDLPKKQLEDIFEDLEHLSKEVDELYRNKGVNKADGGVKLTRNQLLKLKNDLELKFKELNLKVEIVTKTPKFKARLKKWNGLRNTQGSFNPGPPPTIYVRQNCTQLTLQHEVWHMEDLKRFGNLEYRKKPNWKHEESVWNNIWETKHRWTNEELVDSYWYYVKESLTQGGQPNIIGEMEELLKLFPERLKN